MKIIKFLVVGAVLLITGCSSKVVTYDATGQVIGSCKATRGLLSTASAHCGGSGNAIGVNYNTVDAKTGLLPVPPSQNQINLAP
ncbi:MULTISPECIES: hypothetical protein [unclassified Acinetobacter]|uniref:hypothetical protein n=1 Tax=unclassified Acinetobacter TaxID=196816 RepID=UPI0015D31101|nr:MULTISPECIES: hypothetical protein [unclassified Acinetobacter]UUS56682.1 hypothetical protein MST16_11395 [Acinetobacter sp. YH16040_T]UUS64280.1 hypothetical protein MST18_10435 [Acinetobacter sp. YH12068_T]